MALLASSFILQKTILDYLMNMRKILHRSINSFAYLQLPKIEVSYYISTMEKPTKLIKQTGIFP